MPKKKPIAKRLDKLFDDIKHEEPSAKPKADESIAAPEEKPRPSTESKSAAKRSRTAAETARTVCLHFETYHLSSPKVN